MDALHGDGPDLGVAGRAPDRPAGGDPAAAADGRHHALIGEAGITGSGGGRLPVDWYPWPGCGSWSREGEGPGVRLGTPWAAQLTGDLLPPVLPAVAAAQAVGAIADRHAAVIRLR